MAVTFDAASGAAGNGTTTVTWSHTTTGANRYLLVFSIRAASGVTYNAVPMAQIGTSGIWGLVAPATGGAHNVVVTTSTASVATDFYSAISFAGADQITPTAAPFGVGLTLSSTTASTSSPSTNAAGLIASTVFISGFDQAISITSGTTRVQGNGGTNYAQSATQVGSTATTSWSIAGAAEDWTAVSILVLPVNVPTVGRGVTVPIKPIYRSVIV